MPVLDQLVKIRWSYRSKSKYIKLGIPFTKIGEYFDLHIDLVPDDSNVDVLIKCDTCNNESYKKLGNLKSRNKTYCGSVCTGKANYNKIEFNCEECGKLSRKTQTDYHKHQHHFCSQSCASFFFGKLKSKERREQCTCEHCRETYFTVKSQIERLGSRFCSVSCRNQWESINIRGTKHHRFSADEIPCTYCKELIYVRQHRLKLQENHFCGTDCRQKWFAEVWSQNSNWKEASRLRAVELLKNNRSITNTKCQVKVNNLLSDLNVHFVNEYDCKYYSADNYLVDYNLIIEVMGDYWHSNPVKYSKLDSLNKMQMQNLGRDKAKNKYISKYLNINVLYLWETDIKRNIELCKKLIIMYVNNKGNLKDYNSFIYKLDAVTGATNLNDEIITPYFMKNKH